MANQNEVNDEFEAKGLDKVREKLRLENLTKTEKRAYNAFAESQLAEKSMFKDARPQGLFDGRREGKVEGKAEGRTEEKRSNIIKALTRGKLTVEEIAEDFNVSAAGVLAIQKTL